MNNPIITIITVSFNAISIIEDTIKSVINQSYPNIEYIIVDGGSKDGTLDIIKKYKKNIAHIVCEPDKGIYDAMNKGINLASGEWINFMNCGDSFYDANTINQIVDAILENKKVDIIYGNTIINSNVGKYLVLPENIENLSKHLPFCHQSTFVRASLAKKNPFDLQYKFVADYNFFFNAYKNNHSFYHLNKPVANYQIEEGFSASNMNKCIIEEHIINNTYISSFAKFKNKLRSFLINNLPKKIVEHIRATNYKTNPRFIKL